MRQKNGKYYEVKLSYDKVMEDGLVKKVKETFVVEDFNCGKSEERALVEIGGLNKGEAECVGVSLAQYKDVFFTEEGEIYYKVKVNIITIDDNGREKKTAVYHLTNSNSLEGARKNVTEAYSGSLVDYDIAAISETAIQDVFEK